MSRKRRFFVSICGCLLGCTWIGLWLWYFVGTWAGSIQVLLGVGIFIACLVPAGLVVLAAYWFRDRGMARVNKNANQH